MIEYTNIHIYKRERLYMYEKGDNNDITKHWPK